MTKIEFGGQTISLEWYLDHSNSKVFENHDHLSHFIEEIDPRIMLTEPLSERMHPLTAEDLTDIKSLAFIHPVGNPETITFDFGYNIIDDPIWWKVLGDPIEKVEIYDLNVRLTETRLPDWKLVLIKRIPEKIADDEYSFSIGWVSKEELKRLKKIAIG